MTWRETCSTQTVASIKKQGKINAPQYVINRCNKGDLNFHTFVAPKIDEVVIVRSNGISLKLKGI